MQVRPLRQGQLLKHKVQQFALQLDGVLDRSWPRRLDVAGQGEGAGPEVERPDRLPFRSGEVHQVADAAQVLVEDFLGMRHVDVGLFGAADAEDIGAVDEGRRPQWRHVGRWSAGTCVARVPAVSRHHSFPRRPARRPAASSRTSTFLQNANRSRLRVRSAPCGWQNTGNGDRGHPYQCGKPAGQVHRVADAQRGGVHVHEVRALRGEDVETGRAEPFTEDVALVPQRGRNACVEVIREGEGRRRWRTGTACRNCRSGTASRCGWPTPGAPVRSASRSSSP